MLNCKLQDTNYRAKIVKIDRLEPHPGADRLAIAIVDYQRIIVGLDTKIGDLYVYFPLESALNLDFLSFSNSFSSSEMNKDNTKKSFFGKQGRCKATRLRGELSEGYLHPIKSVNDFLKESKVKFEFSEENVGQEFDSVGDIVFCKKYVNKSVNTPSSGNKKQKKAKRSSKLIEDQFRLHFDTAQIKKNIHKVNPEDTISVSYKIHGTSAVFAKVLCKKPLKLHEKILKRIGVNIVDSHYDYLYSSRKVVKNIFEDKAHQHFYNLDIWGLAFEEVKDKLKDGISLYCEIAGFLPNGKTIQKGFDYGFPENKHGIFVYRITYTTSSGQVFEFSTPQMQRYCERYELNMPPLFYYGKAKDMYPELDISNHWQENFLNNLIRDYTEKDCFMCVQKSPEEGIVVVKEGEVWDGYKLKSNRFYEYESVQLDSGEENIEDEG